MVIPTGIALKHLIAVSNRWPRGLLVHVGIFVNLLEKVT